MDQKLSPKEIIARRGAKEVKDGFIINLGIGVPTLIPQFLNKDIYVTFQWLMRKYLSSNLNFC